MSNRTRRALKSRLLICLDYDETYTADPALWHEFIQLAKSRGHVIICATMRYEFEGDEVKRQLGPYCDQIFFTGRKAKRLFIEEQGYSPSIWIDDSPHWIEADSY